MRITAIRQLSVNLQGQVANAVVDFSKHTVSLVAVVSDQVRHGAPVVGLAFNSIGRFAQGGILCERMMPRLLQADPETLQAHTPKQAFSPGAVAACVLQDEKPGGHGDRAGAAAALELAIWDLNAKLADEPAYAHIRQVLDLTPDSQGTPVYAAGGYYYPAESIRRLEEEILRYQDAGYHRFKIKIGGVPLARDLARIEAVINAVGNAQAVAVDANGRFDLATAQAYAAALGPYGLGWFEEPGDPLDYELNQCLTEVFPGPIATGENLFSLADSRNLLRYGGLRADKDLLQMDPGLSYGLTEYLQILALVEASGYQRRQCVPHGGHLINLHLVTALGLGACEAYPGVFQPFGGFSPQCKLDNGHLFPGDTPGFGLEQKPELQPYINQLLET